MNLEKIFKNLILLNIGMFILIIISSSYQSTIITDITKNLDSGFFDTQFGIALVLSLIHI